MSPFVGGRWKKTCNIFKFVEKIRFRKDDQIIALNTFGIRNEQHLRCTWSRRIFSLLSLCLRNDALIETLSHLIYEERKIESFDDIFGFHAECNLKVNNRAIIHSPAAGSEGSTDKMLIWNIHNLDRCQLLDAHPFNYIIDAVRCLNTFSHSNVFYYGPTHFSDTHVNEGNLCAKMEHWPIWDELNAAKLSN